MYQHGFNILFTEEAWVGGKGGVRKGGGGGGNNKHGGGGRERGQLKEGKEWSENIGRSGRFYEGKRRGESGWERRRQ